MENAVEIHCETSGKLLARRDAKGVYLWCKACKTEHFISWNSEIDKVPEHAIRQGDFTLILEQFI